MTQKLLLVISCVFLVYICTNLEYLQSLETSTLILIHNSRNLLLDAFFRISTLFGYELLVLLIPVFSWLENKRLKKLGFDMTSHAIFILYIATLLKLYYKELRPYQVIPSLVRDISASADFSFPSGHTACSAMVWVVLGSYLTETYPDKSFFINIFIITSSLFVGKVFHY